MNKKVMPFLWLAIVLIAGGFALSVLHDWRNISTTGRIKTLGVDVYQDPNLTITLESIDWGILAPAENASYLCYILNTGNFPILLTMWTDNFTPANASQYLSLSWNYTDTELAPAESLAVTFMLAVDADISGITDFSFDIWIAAI